MERRRSASLIALRKQVLHLMRVTSLLLMAVSLHSVLSVAALPRIQVDPASGFFVDPAGRARLFHGVNAVEKKHPFLPPRASLSHRSQSRTLLSAICSLANLTRSLP